MDVIVKASQNFFVDQPNKWLQDWQDGQKNVLWCLFWYRKYYRQQEPFANPTEIRQPHGDSGATRRSWEWRQQVRKPPMNWESAPNRWSIA